MKSILSIVFIFWSLSIMAQGYVYQTFKHGKIINNQSVETLKTWDLDFVVSHRFGDAFGVNGGWKTFYGIENAADILIGLRYGLNDNLEVGVSRTKGGSPLGLDKNINTYLKYRILRQKEKGMPISLAIYTLSSISTSPKSFNKASLKYFDKFIHRIVYHTQLMVARKFSPGFSLQLGGGYTHRNKAYAGESNGIFNAQFGTRIQITKVWGMLFDATVPFAPHIQLFKTHQPSLGIGFEIETGGGHVFKFGVTNSRGLMETDYIPYTVERFEKGEFRLGFTISRLFRI